MSEALLDFHGSRSVGLRGAHVSYQSTRVFAEDGQVFSGLSFLFFRFFSATTPPATPASYRIPPRARQLPTAFVRSGPQEDWGPKRGSYHPKTATSVRGSHGQTTRRAPPEAADGRKTSRGEDPGKGRPEPNWMDCLKDDF